ncbi:hypothetical protein EIP91_007398 [Steccherinum ochraceum]|uniref:Uncharacterized protein n=1 Tax=Steccherinum ochraceum TaxID=92696 RepID=A0A4R0RS36_9APHY|nr:hypothetical protein EIP91_007398 [Steccherinum ochraceum]
MEDDPGIHRGVCQLAPASYRVLDADEEVFILYTTLAAKSNEFATNTTGFRGLGFLDSQKDILTIPFELNKIAPKADGLLGRKAGKKAQRKGKLVEDKSFEVQLVQDKTALRSRKGDTGSVLWRASVELAQFLLEQHFSAKQDALLNSAMLEDAHILELGAGTGLLAIALTRLVRHYTVTDMEELLPLIRKNLRLNLAGWDASSSPRPHGTQTEIRHDVKAEALDWLTLQKCSPNTRRSAYSFEPIDLLLVVDCIYHPFLLPALVETIDYLSTPERTAVLVVVELRAEDVIREFLELWLEASGRGTWEVWHVNEIMDGPYAAWIGWKKQLQPD